MLAKVCEFPLYPSTRLEFSEGRDQASSSYSSQCLTQGWTQSSFFLNILIDSRPFFTFFIPTPSCVCRRKSNVWSSVKYPGVGWLQTDKGAINSIYRKKRAPPSLPSPAPASGNEQSSNRFR